MILSGEDDKSISVSTSVKERKKRSFKSLRDGQQILEEIKNKFVRAEMILKVEALLWINY